MRLARIARDTASLGSPIVVDGAGRFAVDALLTVVAANHRSFAGPRFDDEASTEGLRFLRALVGEGLMSSDVVTARPGAGVERMVRGDALALIGASTDVVAFGPAVAEFQFVPFPAGPTGAPVSLVSGWGLVVTRQSRRPELAVRTAVEMARQTDETAAAALGLIPASAAGYATPEDDASSLRRALRSGRPRPWTAGHPVLAAQLERVFEAVVSGRLRPRDAALAAHEVHDAVTAAVLG